MPTFLKLVTIRGHKVSLYSYDGVTWASDRVELNNYQQRIIGGIDSTRKHFKSVSHDEDAIKRVAITLRQRQRKSLIQSRGNRMSAIKANGSRVRLPKKQLQLMQLEAM